MTSFEKGIAVMYGVGVALVLGFVATVTWAIVKLVLHVTG